MITTGNWQDALEPIARKNYNIGFDEIPAEKSLFYNVQKSDKLTETMFEIGDIGATPEFTGSVQYDEIVEGYKFTVTAKEYSKGIKIQRKFARTDQQDIVTGLPNNLGVSMNRRIAADVFFPFNNAFNTSITTLDGLALCSAAHTSAVGGTNQSNLGTSAFSAVSLEASRVAFKKFRTNKDNPAMFNPDMLVGGIDLEEQFWEVINSTGKVDTANNNANFSKGKYKMVTSVWFTDPQNWFVCDSRLMKLYLQWFDLDLPEFNQARDFDGMTAKYNSYAFYSYVPRDWRFVFGNQVS